MHIEWVESPLHDKDLNASGEAKKPHIHILLLFGGVKSYEQVKEITDSLNCPIPQRCHNARALVRYMAHLDNPEKHQYYNSCSFAACQSTSVRSRKQQDTVEYSRKQQNTAGHSRIQQDTAGNSKRRAENRTGFMA